MRHENAPVIIDSGSPKLILRPLERSDIAAWYSYLSIPEVIQHTSWNLKAVNDLIPVIDNYNSDGVATSIRFAIIDVTSGNFVGDIGFHSISPANKTTEIAFSFHPDYWGKGIATRCCNAVVKWGFAVQGYVRIQATVVDSNLASRRVIEKCDFALEGKLRNFRMIRGQPRDYFMFSRINDCIETATS